MHVFCPDDTLLLLGSEAQLDVAERYLTETQKLDSPIQETDFDFDQIVITDNHPLLTETIASANLRKRFGLNIVGIQRKNERIEKLTPSDMFKAGDCILLVGHRNNIEKFKASLTTAVAKA
ncbi:MAG: cation:proton antiporter regulatory subunit [bacterium]